VEAPLTTIATVVRAARVRPFDLSLQLSLRKQLVALCGGPRPIATRLSQEGQGVRIDVLARGPLDDAEVQRAIDDAAALSGVDDDPGDFPLVAQRHPLVAKMHDQFPGARLGRAPTVWEVFATSVVEQLVTFGEAQQAVGRMRARFGLRVTEGLRAFPTAETIAKVAPFELRALGVGMRRATTLILGARLGDRLERLRGIPIEEAMAWLQQLKGVGPWTANKVAIGALNHADGVLVGDAGMPFVTTMALTGKAGGDAEMLDCLAPFSPHRARVTKLFNLAHVKLRSIPGVPTRRGLPTIDPHRRSPWKY
jgi:3-methyladenine DNA glycosylase/8-oxoguanine DNA glycosylase